MEIKLFVHLQIFVNFVDFFEAKTVMLQSYLYLDTNLRVKHSMLIQLTIEL